MAETKMKSMFGIRLANEVLGMTPRQKCPHCTFGFKQKGSVIDSVAHFGGVFIHRRCLEEMLEEAPLDVNKHDELFEGYREKLIQRIAG